jgi:pterin-4a-carbinolamine dehydratase
MLAGMSLFPLSDPSVAQALEELPGWSLDRGALAISWRFMSFLDVLEWMQACAPDIERLDHFPYWSHHRDQIDVRLYTHSIRDGITNLDLELARRLHHHAQRFGARPVEL